MLSMCAGVTPECHGPTLISSCGRLEEGYARSSGSSGLTLLSGLADLTVPCTARLVFSVTVVTKVGPTSAAVE